MITDIVYWDFERSHKRKEKGISLDKIKLEKVVIPEDWSVRHYEKFRDILELPCGIEEEHLPHVLCMITDRHCVCPTRLQPWNPDRSFWWDRGKCRYRGGSVPSVAQFKEGSLSFFTFICGVARKATTS